MAFHEVTQLSKSEKQTDKKQQMTQRMVFTVGREGAGELGHSAGQTGVQPCEGARAGSTKQG